MVDTELDGTVGVASLGDGTAGVPGLGDGTAGVPGLGDGTVVAFGVAVVAELDSEGLVILDDGDAVTFEVLDVFIF